MPLGTVGGIQVKVNWSTAVIFALIAFGLAAWDFPAVNPRQATLTWILAGILTTLAYFASLLARELAHSLVAQHYGPMRNSKSAAKVTRIENSALASGEKQVAGQQPALRRSSVIPRSV